MSVTSVLRSQPAEINKGKNQAILSRFRASELALRLVVTISLPNAKQSNVALERLAHATTNKGYLQASPLQARVSWRVEERRSLSYDLARGLLKPDSSIVSIRFDTFPIKIRHS
jgi:hypothetical protein